MKKMQFAVVDIETTGGFAGNNKITEIAIIIMEGTEVIDRYVSLVNPMRMIPTYITGFTGISNDMVADAPFFGQIAPKVYELLNNKIFVAHNVNFDYSFVRHELESAGFPWTAAKLCTVRTSRKIKPGLPSYSLGRLCHSLNIPLVDRHRAGGDADATAILLSKLLDWDVEGIIDKMIKKNTPEQRLPPHLNREEYEVLPNVAGVYYFYNQHHKVIYVGKAIDIKKRVSSHFTGHKITPQRQHFMRDIHHISFEPTGTELIALLLEFEEVQKLWPIYNKALKRFEAKFGLFNYEAINGYEYLAVGKMQKFQTCVEVFSKLSTAVRTLQEMAEKHQIDYRFCIFGIPDTEFRTNANQKLPLPDLQEHNDKIQEAIAELLENRPSFYILDSGRTGEERSCILVLEGKLYGIGYFEWNESIGDLEDLKGRLRRVKSTQYLMYLIYQYSDKNPAKVFNIDKSML